MAGGYVRDCAVDEVGIIVISGANVFEGYLVPEDNRGLWIEMGDGRRWLNTGDLGREDDEGYFWLTGRKKELIIRGGHNIDPQLIEAPLQDHPAVLFAAAIARPDAHAGELPVAYVQPPPGAAATEAELRPSAPATASAPRCPRPPIRIVADHAGNGGGQALQACAGPT